MRKFLPTCSVLLASCLSLVAQGPLEPPGAPAPTMKTLDQVEARIPINATTAPGDDGSLFWITKPGSYYLTGNVTGVSGKSGIKVGAVDVAIAVTIDLNGFSVTGVPGSNVGIVVLGSPLVTVRNGFVTRWGGTGMFLSDRAQVDGVTAEGNGGKGIETGGSSLITNCIVADSGDTGIYTAGDSNLRSVVCRSNVVGATVGSGSVVSHSTFRANQQHGLGISSGTTVQNCAADSNNSHGIFAGDNMTIVDCNVTGNIGHGILAGQGVNIQRTASSRNRNDGIRVGERAQITNCVVNANGEGGSAGLGSGIAGGIRTIVKQCTATGNRVDGISVLGESVVVDNRASANGTGGAGLNAAGIRTANGSGSRVEANHARDNTGVGIKINDADVVIRNSAGANTGGNYRNQADLAPTGPNVGTIGNLTTTSNPFANLQ